MKTKLLQLLILLFIAQWNASIAQIYVNDDATGINDGTSWENAFTSLQDALAAAVAGDQIWVAEGAYLPGTDSAGSFIVEKNLFLYGGFAGTEMTLEERGDPADHPSILSGDLNGDDVENDFETNRGDNAWTVMTVTPDVTNETIIDGFTFSNGHSNGSGDDFSPSRSGGGLHCLGNPRVQNCLFRQNFSAFRGGGAFFNYEGDELLEVVQCTFNGNNSSGRGGGANILNSNCRVTNCSFVGNIANQMGGGLRYINESGFQFIEITGCHFENNQSSFGGGLRLQQSNLINPNTEGNITFLVSNCTFIGNAAAPLQPNWGQGGGGLNGVFYPNTKNNILAIDSCQFLQNSSTGNAPAIDIASAGKENTAYIKNCTVRENMNTGGFGTMSIFESPSGTNLNAIIENCIVENNSNTGMYSSSGLDIGGDSNAGPSNFTLRNCKIRNNHSETLSGGITLWGENNYVAQVLMEDCEISDNTANEMGGGVLISTSSNDFHITMDRCIIQGNHSGWGSAIASARGYLYTNNLPEGASVTLKNSLVTDNSGGHAIALDSLPGFSMLNVTVANNEGSGLALKNSSGAVLQNTILYNNQLNEFEALTNDVSISSNGGNIIGDDSFTAANSYDQPGTDPLLDEKFKPMGPNSPAIDKGVDLGNLSDLDFEGNQRVHGCVDIGAFESYLLVSTECLTDAKEEIIGQILLSPNPATDFIQLQLPESIGQANEISLFDAQGRLVQQLPYTPGQQVQTGHLPGGFYLLKLSDGERVYIGKFVKQ